MSQTTATLPADAPFTDEQKEYIAGYLAGVAARQIVPFAGHLSDGRITHEPEDGAANLAAPPEEEKTAFGVPIDELSREERLKLEENPLDLWDKILAHAAADKPPEGGDVFRFKYHGLFYVAPNQDSFMLRVRVPAASSPPDSSAAWHRSPATSAAAMATSPRAPTCSSANFRRATSPRC